MQISALRSERDQEVKTLAAKMEVALANAHRNVADAERMMEAKEALLARWKEEAQLVGGGRGSRRVLRGGGRRETGRSGECWWQHAWMQIQEW